MRYLIIYFILTLSPLSLTAQEHFEDLDLDTGDLSPEQHLDSARANKENRKRLKAILHYFEAVIAYHKDGDHAEAVALKKDIGSLFFSIGNYKAALTYYHQALLEPRTDIGDTIRAKLNYNLGLTCRHADLDSFARGYMAEAKRLFERLRMTDDLADTYIELGILDRKGKEYGTARAYYRKSLGLVTAKGPAAAKALNNIGNAYLHEGDMDSAEYYFTKSLRIRESISPRTLGSVYNNLASIALRKADTTKALELYQSTVEVTDPTSGLLDLKYDYDTALRAVKFIFEERGQMDAYISYDKLWDSFMIDKVGLLEASIKLANYMTGVAAQAEIERRLAVIAWEEAEAQLRFWAVLAAIVLLLALYLYLRHIRNQKDIVRLLNKCE